MTDQSNVAKEMGAQPTGKLPSSARAVVIGAVLLAVQFFIIWLKWDGLIVFCWKRTN
mgnify:CR=1 FL=1